MFEMQSSSAAMGQLLTPPPVVMLQRHALSPHPLEGGQSASAAHSRHSLARQKSADESSTPVPRVQHSGERGDGQDAVLLSERSLERVGQTSDARVVARVAPATPGGQTVLRGSVPVAVQLPVHVAESHADEVWG